MLKKILTSQLKNILMCSYVLFKWLRMSAGKQAKGGDIFRTNYIQENILLPVQSRELIVKLNSVFHMVLWIFNFFWFDMFKSLYSTFFIEHILHFCKWSLISLWVIKFYNSMMCMSYYILEYTNWLPVCYKIF